MVLYLTIGLPVLCIIALKGSTVVVSLYALELGAGSATIGILIGLYALFPTLLSVASGRLLDRVGYLPPIAWGSVGVIGGLLVPVLMPDMIGLSISAALLGLSNVYFIVPMQSLVNRIATGAERARNVANFSLAISIGQLVGPAKRDVTPEATLAIGDREMPGFGEQMRQISLRFVATAILSRQVAVIRGESLIINLPGQPKSIRETLEGLKDGDGKTVVPGIFAAVPYCVDLIGGPYIETHEAVVKAFRPKKK